MKPASYRYLLFPHMVLGEKDSRHLAVFFPGLSVLEVLRPPLIPEWAVDRFSGFPITLGQKEEERIAGCIRGYQEMSRLGEEVDLASLSCDWLEDTHEKRFQIQEKLKGKAGGEANLPDKLFVEGAVFLEMARDLDEKELELEESYANLGHLEEQFQEIIGINPEDDLDDAIDTLSPPLWSEKSGQTYMLHKRIAFWLRLLSARMPDEPQVFVSVTPEIMEELLDPIRNERDKAGKPLNILRRSLALVPALDKLRNEEFQALLRELQDRNTLAPYWESLERVLSDPGDVALRGELDERVDTLRKAIEDFCRKTESFDEHEKIELTLIAPEHCTHDDLWKCIDSGGHEALKEHIAGRQSPSALLCLS